MENQMNKISSKYFSFNKNTFVAEASDLKHLFTYNGPLHIISERTGKSVRFDYEYDVWGAENELEVTVFKCADNQFKELKVYIYND